MGGLHFQSTTWINKHAQIHTCVFASITVEKTWVVYEDLYEPNLFPHFRPNLGLLI